MSCLIHDYPHSAVLFFQTMWINGDVIAATKLVKESKKMQISSEIRLERALAQIFIGRE